MSDDSTAQDCLNLRDTTVSCVYGESADQDASAESKEYLCRVKKILIGTPIDSITH